MYWVYLLKGMIIYGLIPASCAVLLTIDHIQKDKMDEDIKTLFKKYYKQFDIYKVQSFIFALFIILCYTALFYLNRTEGNISIFLTVIFIYLLAMILTIFSYCINLLAFKGQTIKQAFLLSFYMVFKHVLISFSIIAIISILYASALKNFAFFIIFGPFLYGIGIKFAVRKVIE
jgi:uncharacterized membrane protein YesL